MNETQGGVRRDTILDRYSIEPLDSLFCTPAEETALLIKLRRKVISQFMCRSRPSLPRAALFSLPHRRRITLHALLFSASSARTVLFLLFSCSSSFALMWQVGIAVREELFRRGAAAARLSGHSVSG